MKPEETVLKFIALRARALSFERIHQELNVGHGTLIEWSRKYLHQIRNLQQVETEALREKYGLTRRASAQQLSSDIERVRQELAKRDLSPLSVSRRLNLASLLRAEANRLDGPVHFSQPVQDSDPIPDETLPVVTWEI
jgi:DNA-binding transcriptional regulator YiaG